jgi:FkbM family methyltransferase
MMLDTFKKNIAVMFAGLLPRAVYEQYKLKYDNKEDFSQTYFSQEGEEIILRRFFSYRNTGFYVDIGAYHPQKFSNTYKLYLLGWKGINIDATPNSMMAFNKLRPKDVNIQAAISNQAQELTFFQFNEGALNTFDEQKANKIAASNNYKLVQKNKIITQTLEQILDKHLIPGQKVDFFSIDVEGLDLKVLKSNNWEKYKPQVVIIETDLIEIDNFLKSPEAVYLAEKGYKCFAKTVKSAFFYTS